MKKRIWIVMYLVLMLLSGCGKVSEPYFVETKSAQEETEEDILENEMEDTEETTKKAESLCYVYVCGAVKNPGVYQLMENARIYEAILLAGGLTEEACEDSINQAEVITDGQMIKVLTAEEIKEAGQTGTAEASDGKVNLNTADVSKLMSLPGIGESKALSILSYRQEQGGFSSVEELMNIPGIKEGVYSKIKDYITVN